MKKPNLLFPVMILLLLIASVSCKDENEPNQPENTVKDIDGNIYKTVKIGDQIWMAENLKVTHYRNGEKIVPTDSSTYYFYEGACFDYDSKAENSSVYGKLYNWYAIGDSRKIAPVGWHVPTNDEWLKLIFFVGGTNDTDMNLSIAGGKLKEADTVHWESPNLEATDDAGFTALPGGYHDVISYFGLNWVGYWWSADEKELYWAWGWNIHCDAAWIRYSDVNKNLGFSVRCVKD